MLMDNKKLYLKPNVFLEPLVYYWYAWAHLIAPATAALNIANSHVKIMKSFVNSPEIHANAVKNPAMRGGPFLDFPAKRVSEIKTLLESTLKDQVIMLDFAEAIKRLNDLLINEARGQSLEDLYEKVPDILRGYVELFYDLNHRAGFRLIEALLYRSPFYNSSYQSVLVSMIESDERPFVFSTPRVPGAKDVHLKIPFNSTAIDELFEMRHTPKSFGHIKEVLGFPSEQDELFKSFLMEDGPEKNTTYDGDSMRIRYLGHASILMECNGVSVLTDPLIGYKSVNSDEAGYSFSDLPQVIDYALLTHTHADHVVLETLLQLRHRIKHIVVPRSGAGNLEDPSLKLLLQQLGFRNVTELDDMESLEIGDGSVTAIPFFGEHADLNIRCKTAYLIRFAGKAILCVADSANLDSRFYELLHGFLSDIDVFFVGMECEGAPLSWIYGSLLMKPIERKMDQSRRLAGSDCQRAMDVVDHLHCKQVYVYAMGQEPWLSFLTSIKYTDESKPIVESNKLVELCRSRGIPSERLLGVKEIYA
jgi:L-ascorbate metabolism protein UlaG (beta-lactamase superfamily)